MLRFEQAQPIHIRQCPPPLDQLNPKFSMPHNGMEKPVRQSWMGIIKILQQEKSNRQLVPYMVVLLKWTSSMFSVHVETAGCVVRASKSFKMQHLLSNIAKMINDRDLAIDSLNVTPYAIRVVLAHELTADDSHISLMR